MRRRAGMKWTWGALLSLVILLASSTQLAAQEHSRNASLERMSGAKRSSAPPYQSAPSMTAWRGEDSGLPQRPRPSSQHEAGYVEINPAATTPSREIAPVKPTAEVAGTKEKETEKKEELVAEKLPSQYLVQIGDRLTVSIYGETNTERDVLVDRAGTITYPIVGTLEVVGKTIDQVRREMNDRIRKVYRYTFVTITPVEFGGQHYTILGSVSVPGKKLLLGKETVLSAICRAGGFPMGMYRLQTIDFADLDHAFLLRKGEYVPVDFQKLVVEGDLKQDVVLHPGDYIYVPNSLDKEIFVMGEVAIPSALGYINKVTLLEALSMAGGTTFNASSRVLVVRGSLSQPYTFYIDYNLILKACQPDFLLRPGDIVYVPPRQFTTFREIVQYAIRIFVSTAASDAGSVSWASVTKTLPINNVNVIPNVPQSGIVPVTPVNN